MSTVVSKHSRRENKNKEQTKTKNRTTKNKRKLKTTTKRPHTIYIFHFFQLFIFAGGSQRSESENDIGTAPSCDVILSVGGVDPFLPEVELQARLVEQFHPQDNSWTTMTRLPDGRHHHGAALVDKAIYIIGDPCFLCVFQRSGAVWKSRWPSSAPRL